MSNMPAVDKRTVSLQLKIKVIAKLDQIARVSGLSRNQIANTMLDEGTKHVLLTDEELEEVNDAIKKNRDKRKKRG